MKKILIYTFFLSVAFLWAGCKKTSYPEGMISPYIPIYDLRNLYKGSDVTLSADNMYGSNSVSGIVVSDHSGGNMPEGLLVLQDKKRLSELRGISIPLGADASKYVRGDSITVRIEGGVLKRVNGLLEITNVAADAVTKIASNKPIAPNRVPSSYILADPDKYESTEVVIVKGGFNPLPVPTDVLSGEKLLNDGFDDITLHTEPTATFANKNNLPIVGNFYGVIFTKLGAAGKLVPEHRMRTAADVVSLSSELKVTPVLISGFINDVKGGDGNYEYIQLVATKDIDFAATPFSVVVTNNAGASTPAGFPVDGWATGGGSLANGPVKATTFRTFKFDLTSGNVSKGEFFYVGGAGKMIDGSSSTSMASSKWIRSFNYTTTDGDGFGIRNGGFFANSGNAFGMAVFEGTTVTKETTPVDVLFVASGGSLFNPGPPAQGYKIGNTDFYDIVDPITLKAQPYYRQGSNTINLTYTTPADVGYFYKLGGIYNSELGKWVKARTQTNIILTKTSTLNEIEGEFPVAVEDQPGVPATVVK